MYCTTWMTSVYFFMQNRLLLIKKKLLFNLFQLCENTFIGRKKNIHTRYTHTYSRIPALLGFVNDCYIAYWDYYYIASRGYRIQIQFVLRETIKIIQRIPLLSGSIRRLRRIYFSRLIFFFFLLSTISFFKQLEYKMKYEKQAYYIRKEINLIRNLK